MIVPPSKLPWARVVLEAAVIVGSILLAFGIDAWWEETQEEAAAAGLAQLLLADIDADIAEMEARNARADSIIGRLGELSVLSRPDAQLPGADSLRILTGATWSAATFTPSLSSRGVMSDGAWDQVPLRLRVLLSEYDQGFMTYNVEADLSAMEALFTLAGDHGGLYLLVGEGRTGEEWAANADLLAGFIRDPHVQTWVTVRRAMVASERDWRAEWITKLTQVAEELTILTDSG